MINLPYEQIEHDFIEELRQASLGQLSSLSYLEHPLPDEPIITTGLVQGIVIGGTNYIISTEQINKDGSRDIMERYTGILPTFKDKETFSLFLEEHLNPQATGIGINFGFPLQPIRGSHKELDGILLSGTKEHSFAGLLGTGIGQEVKSLFREHFKRDIPVSVANDTVCLTLAGDGSEDGSMIAGTGFNIGIKPVSEIIVNIEAGNFDKFESSDALKIIDEASDNPGKQLFEKLISGKYLAAVFNIKAKKMGLTIPELKTSQELSALSQETAENDANELARKLLERSAFLVGTALAGLYEFSGKQELTIIGEGSLLWKGWKYSENVEKKLEELGISKNAVKIKHIQNSSINGAIGLITQ